MPRNFLISRPWFAGAFAMVLGLGLGACDKREMPSTDEGDSGLGVEMVKGEPTPSACDDLDGVSGEMGKAAQRLDLYVHVDVMTCAELSGVQERLEESVRPLLEQQFARAPVASPCGGGCGIKLHMEVQSVGICVKEIKKDDFVCNRSPVPKPTEGMNAFKRHVLWALDFKGDRGKLYSGLTRGSRSIISLGHVYREGLSQEELIQFEAAVLMHELGHSLGLTHGHPSCTRDEVEKKGCEQLPNHLSVMSKYWMTKGVGYGGGESPRDYVPTFQSFETAPLLEQSDQRVVVMPSPGPCPSPLHDPEAESWVRFMSKAPLRPVTRAARDAGEPVRAMDFNGDKQPGGVLWTKGDRALGIPNEWLWMLEHGGLSAEDAAKRVQGDSFSCFASRVKSTWRTMMDTDTKTLSDQGVDDEPDFDDIADEPLVEELLEQFLEE